MSNQKEKKYLGCCDQSIVKYINVVVANQLLIHQMCINKTNKKRSKNKKQYEINDLILRIKEYISMSEFNFISIFQKGLDLILGSTWMTTLVFFILNMEKMF